MSLDVIHDRKRGWKGSQSDYDDVFSRSDRLCSVCLTEQQIVALLSMTEFLYWPTRWVRKDADVDAAVVTQFAENLERNLMMACCDDNLPIQYRYNDAGELERSLNAGGNWTSAPEYDPRVYSPQFPPMPGEDGDDKKCIAATGAAALIKEQVGDQLTDDMTRYTLSQLITDWVKTFIGSSNPFQALLTVVANQIFALILSALRPALTDTVYDIFKCILYCNIGDDATINNAQWAKIRSDITDQIGGIAGIFLEHLIYLLGTTGCSNLLKAGGAAEGDCSECDCPAPCGTNWHVRPDITAYTDMTVGDGYITVSAHGIIGSNYYGIVESGDMAQCCTFDHFEILSGSIELWAWMECNTNTVSTGLPTGHCMHQLGPQSSVPFIVKLFFVDCP